MIPLKSAYKGTRDHSQLKILHNTFIGYAY